VGWDGGINKAVSTKPGSKIFFESGLDTDLPDRLFLSATASLRVMALPSSIIYLHPQSTTVDFIAAKT
jgi:hypothetical protein